MISSVCSCITSCMCPCWACKSDVEGENPRQPLLTAEAPARPYVVPNSSSSTRRGNEVQDQSRKVSAEFQQTRHAETGRRNKGRRSRNLQQHSRGRKGRERQSVITHIPEEDFYDNLPSSTPSAPPETLSSIQPLKKSHSTSSFEEDIINFMTGVIDQREGDVLEKEEMLNNAAELLDKLREAGAGNSSLEFPETSAAADLSCPVCYESLKGRPTCATACGHLFCEECVLGCMDKSDKCPTCRKLISVATVRKIYL